MNEKKNMKENKLKREAEIEECRKLICSKLQKLFPFVHIFSDDKSIGAAAAAWIQPSIDSTAPQQSIINLNLLQLSRRGSRGIRMKIIQSLT